MHYRLSRPGDLDVEFDGDLLASESSRQGDQPRWMEVRIYRTNTGKFVTEMVGRSVVEGEVDRINVKVHTDTDTIRNALLRPGQGGTKYLPDTAFNALFAAGQHDHRIMAILTERI